MKKFRRALAMWGWGLLGGSIAAGAQSVAAWSGFTGAHAAGVDVPLLNFKSMGILLLTGVVSHAVMYVKQSPLPKIEFDDSAPPFPLSDGSNVKPPEPKP